MIDALDYGPQSTDISEGLLTDGGTEIVFFTEPTPGFSNEPTFVKDEYEYSFSLYPNPAYEQTTLAFEYSDFRNIRIYNAAGMKIDEIQSAEREVQLNVASYLPGLYMLEVNSNDAEIHRMKLLVQPN
jgi:hypothetical protein